MNKQTEALKLALEALEDRTSLMKWQIARDAVREALAQTKEPEQAMQVTDEENEQFSRDVSNFKGADPEATKYALEAFLRNRALAQPEQESVTWRNAAIRVGEELSSIGPFGYYDMTAEQWLDWAIEQRPQGKNSLPPQRTWVGLTDEEIWQIATDCTIGGDLHADKFAKAIEAKVKENA